MSTALPRPGAGRGVPFWALSPGLRTARPSRLFCSSRGGGRCRRGKFLPLGAGVGGGGEVSPGSVRGAVRGGPRRSSERLSAAPPAAGNGEPRAERRRWAASGAKRRPPRGPSLEPGSGGARPWDPGGERLRESRAAPPEPVCLWLSGLGREDPGNVVRCSPDTSVNGTVPTDGRGKKEKKSLKS